MKVRYAKNEDIPKIGELLLQVCDVHAMGRDDLFVSGARKYSDDELRKLFLNNERPVLCAVDDNDKVVGYAFCILQDHTRDSAMTDIKTLYLDDLCVDSDSRGQHIGTLLYNTVLELAKKLGCYNVTLNVWSCNPDAQRFYEAMGMKPQKICMETIL